MFDWCSFDSIIMLHLLLLLLPVINWPLTELEFFISVQPDPNVRGTSFLFAGGVTRQR